MSVVVVHAGELKRSFHSSTTSLSKSPCTAVSQASRAISRSTPALNTLSSQLNGRDINLDQFSVPGNSENDDFDQVYAANVQSATTAAKKATPPVTPTPGKLIATPLATPLATPAVKADFQSEKTAVTKPVSTATPTPGYVRQAPPPLGHFPSGKAAAPMTANDVRQATPPPSPGEKIVLMCGPKAENARRYQRDYVIGGTAPSHVISLHRYATYKRLFSLS